MSSIRQAGRPKPNRWVFPCCLSGLRKRAGKSPPRAAGGKARLPSSAVVRVQHVLLPAYSVGKGKKLYPGQARRPKKGGFLTLITPGRFAWRMGREKERDERGRWRVQVPSPRLPVAKSSGRACGALHLAFTTPLDLPICYLDMDRATRPAPYGPGRGGVNPFFFFPFFRIVAPNASAVCHR